MKCAENIQKCMHIPQGYEQYARNARDGSLPLRLVRSIFAEEIYLFILIVI